MSTQTPDPTSSIPYLVVLAASLGAFSLHGWEHAVLTLGVTTFAFWFFGLLSFR